MEKIKINDESGDRKYFTQLPHYILNHSTAIDQALYWQMKRYAGETGKCFATQETLMKKLGIGRKAYNKSLKYLLSKEWIKFIGLIGGKTRPVKTYTITDIWKLNILNYEKIQAERTLSIKEIQVESNRDTGQKNSKIQAERTIEEQPIKEEPINNSISNAKALPINLRSEYMKERKNNAKKEAIAHYTNGENKCSLCGFSDFDYLEIDHENKNGNLHRKENNLSCGVATYRWLIRNNYPTGFRVLCRKCNNNQSSVANPINSLIELFKPINPSYKRLYSSLTERNALERMIKELTYETLKRKIELLPQILEMPYAPRISTPYQLEKKFGQLEQFLKQENNLEKGRKKVINLNIN